MKNLHDIIQKNIKHQIDMYRESVKDVPFKTFGMEEWLTQSILSSQLSIIQAIDEMIDEVIKNKEQVNGFQPYHTCDEECEVNCKRLRDERKIFFDGWDDGRNLMKIDLMRIRSFLDESKTKLQ